MMIFYNADDEWHDLWLVQWWGTINRLGERATMLGPRCTSLRRFYELFEPPTVLAFKVDNRGIWIATWMTPCFHGAFFNLWVAPHMRHRRWAAEVLFDAYAMGFRHFPVLLGVTRQQRLLKQHMRLGYQLVGELPEALGDGPMWLVTLTQDAFETHVDQLRVRHARERQGAGHGH